MRHDIILADGGMGRELQRLGAPFRQPEWSAQALLEAPEFVGQAHTHFANAGAQLITTNSYAIVPFHLGEERFTAQGQELAALAGRCARTVADAYNVRVAGSLPPALGSYRADLFEPETARTIISVLIAGLSPHVDLWLAETLSTLEEARLVAGLLSEDERPLWISFTLNDDGAAMLRSGESIEAAAALAKDLGVAALLFNCSAPEVMEDAVTRAKAALGAHDLRIGVYANGFDHNDDPVEANEGLRTIRADLDPENYLVFARKWIAAGASIVGGCCGIGPEHIKALSDGLN
jgi:S-methylmethionine-dependent homocysteine/selenocysteine methylase